MTHITDSHCHLDFPQFADELPEIINRAHESGVTRMMSIATTPKGLPNVKTIAANHPSVFYAYGIHPLHVDEQPMVTLEELVTEAAAPKMLAIGETGLDYHYSADTKAMQIESLYIHVTAAQTTGLPLVIHSRAADEDMAEILTTRFEEKPFTCVMHCFSSGPELAKAMLDCGFYLSMSGVTTFKNSNELRNIFRTAPLDRILVETDAPYLAPVPHRGRRNEPAYVAETAHNAASLFGVSYETFAAQTQENFDRVFPKVKQWRP